jgi:hypothetical protein
MLLELHSDEPLNPHNALLEDNLELALMVQKVDLFNYHHQIYIHSLDHIFYHLNTLLLIKEKYIQHTYDLNTI